MPSSPLGDPISSLTDASTLDGTETVAVVQSTRTKKTTLTVIADWIKSAFAASSGASLVGFTQSGTGATATDLQTRGRKVFYSSDYDTLANAVTAAYGAVLRVLEGTHTLTSILSISSPIEIHMEPGAILDFSGVAAGTALRQRKLIHIAGSKGGAIDISTSVAVGDTQIEVASSSTLAAGDWVTLESDEFYSDGAAASSPNRGFMARIKSVDDGTHVTLDRKSPFALLTADNANLYRLTMVDGVVIRGGTITGGGTGDVHNGIYAYCTSNLRIENVEIEGCEDTGVSLDHSVGFSVRDNIISGATSPGGAIGNTGYGVAPYDGSCDGLIEGNQFYNCRHAVAGGGEPCVFNIEVRGNRATNCGLSTQAFDCHEPCFHWSFVGNRAVGGDGGLIVRGSYTVVDGNHFYNTSGVGIRVKPAIEDTNSTRGTVIVNNVVINPGSTAIEIDGDNSQITEFVIRGNIIKNTPLNGILGQYLSHGTISENVINGITSNTGTAGNGIQLTGASTGDVTAVTIAHNVIRDTMRNGVSVRYGRRINVAGNQIEDIVNSAVLLQDSEECNVTGNQLLVDQTDNFYGVEVSICDRVAITGNRIKGLSTNSSSDGIRVYAGSGSSDQITITGNIVDGVGRNAVQCTNTTKVILVGNDFSGSTNNNKVVLTSVDSAVRRNNICAIHDGGMGPNRGDAAATLIPTQSDNTQLWSTTLTADRAVTLSTTGAQEGDEFHIIRTAAGAFNLNVGTGPLAALTENQWCIVIYTGSAWALKARGSMT